MSAPAIAAAVAEIDRRLALARDQAIAGLRMGIAAAVCGRDLPAAVDTEDTWWADGITLGYDAAKEG